MNLTKADITQAIEKKMDRSNWKAWKFSDLVENIVEKVVPKESGLDHYIGLKHLDSGSLHIRRFGGTASIEGDKLKIYKGDFIFAKRNSYLKRVAIAEFDAVASAHALVLRAKPENVLPEFLPFFLLSEKFWERAIEISVGSLSPTINWRVLAKQEFLLPPKEQQAEIAELLWAIDKVIQKGYKNLSNLSILIESYRADTFNRERWTMGKLEEQFEVQLGKMLSSKSKRGEAPYPYLTNKNVQWGEIVFDKLNVMDFNEKERAKFSLQDGDLLVCEGGEVGRAAIWRGQKENCFYQKALHRLRSKECGYLPEVMLEVMKWAQSKGILKGLTGHTTIAHLTAVMLKGMKIPLIPIEDQAVIRDKFHHLDSSKKEIRLKIESSKLLQKSLINQAL